MNSKNIYVIIIDDEELISKMLKDYLEDYGLIVTTAKDGKDGLKLLKETKYDAAIVDMRLPDMVGNNFILQAYKIQPQIKYFIHTGSLNYIIPENLIALGIDEDAILQKPVSDMKLIYDAIIEKTDHQ